jgi:hypothetical protein
LKIFISGARVRDPKPWTQCHLEAVLAQINFDAVAIPHNGTLARGVFDCCELQEFPVTLIGKTTASIAPQLFHV